MNKILTGSYFTLLIAGFSIIILSGCRDKHLERRITALERRVQALEENKTVNPLAGRVNHISAPERIKGGENISQLVFEETEFDFGTIIEGDVINHTFSFKNTGNLPLIIEKASASCGCTVPKWPKKPIPVGGTGKIDVKFDSKNKPNRQIKTITITANTDPAITRLKIMGFVTPKSKLAGPVKK